ncbi:Or9e37 [Eciton burchellii]|nr:Or9e37 [Eciton burchellii]
MKISFEERYFKWNRIILLAVGLWPYQQSKLTRLQITFFLSILISNIIFLFSRLLFVEYTFDFTIKIICISFYVFFFGIKYLFFWINMETMKCLIEQLQNIYNSLRDKNEIAIYDKHGKIAKRVTVMFIIVEMCSLLFTITLECWGYIFDIIFKNEIYVQHLKLFIYKYFFVQEKYFYILLLHVNAVFAVGSFSLVVTSTMIFSCVKHICGMFRIASYRLEQAMKNYMLQNINVQNKIMIYEEIISAVNIHRKAMEFGKFLTNNLEVLFFLIIVITVLCMSFSLYRISRISSPIEEIEEISLHIIIITSILLYLFLVNYAGQELKDYNDHVFFIAYNISWYQAPLQVQKLILFLLQRGNKAFIWNIGGLFIVSFECFASLVSASVSYFTIMLSFQ